MNLSNKDYREDSAISRSELWKLKKSPLHFKYAMDNPSERTPALIFGSAAHKYILEKDKFFDEYAIAPDVDRRTKEGKAKYQMFCEENRDKEIITEDDWETILEMESVIDAHPFARKLLTGQVEQSFFWNDTDTGEKCKCRPDVLSNETYNGKKLIVDYKTTDSCEDGHFERSCRKYGYKFQAGMYREGVFQNTYDDYSFCFVAQEKTAPYAVRVYFCSDEFIDQGYDEFRELIGLYHYCKEQNYYPGYEGFTDDYEILSEEER